jgi:uncharacterized protein YqfA (UPF0365 family)
MPRIDASECNKDSSMRYSSHLILAVATIALISCGKAPALTEAEDQPVDQPVAQAKAEQDRAYDALVQGQEIALEQERARSREAPPIVVAGAPEIRPTELGQQSPRESRIPASSGIMPAVHSRPGS